MPERVLLTLHLPIDVRTAARIGLVVARGYPGARLRARDEDPQTCDVVVDESPS